MVLCWFDAMCGLQAMAWVVCIGSRAVICYYLLCLGRCWGNAEGAVRAQCSTSAMLHEPEELCLTEGKLWCCDIASYVRL